MMKIKELAYLESDDVLINKNNGNIFIFTMFMKNNNIMLEHLLGKKMCTYQIHEFNYLADLEFYTPEIGKKTLLNLLDKIQEEHLIYFSEEIIRTEHYKDYIKTLLSIKNMLYNQYNLILEITEETIIISRACKNLNH